MNVTVKITNKEKIKKMFTLSAPGQACRNRNGRGGGGRSGFSLHNYIKINVHDRINACAPSRSRRFVGNAGPKEKTALFYRP